MKSIVIIIPYFGKFPDWADLFFETLKLNNTIDFLFYTDCDTTKYVASNIKFVSISFEEYINMVNSKIGINFKPKNAYKLCDLRPLYGIIHKDDFSSYDFYGWTDMDILFGNIRQFYTNDILSKYDVISTHKIRISGHLALFKNNHRNRNRYKLIYKWKEYLQNENFVGLDEHGLTNAYTLTIFDKINQKFNLNIDNIIIRYFSRLKKRKLFLVEQFTTPFTSIPWIDGSLDSMQPNVWYYIDGNITNIRDGSRNFIYLHFMNFKSSIWRHDKTKSPWEGKKRVCFASTTDMKNGLKICNEGILPLN